MEYYNQNYGKIVTEKVAVAVKADRLSARQDKGPPRQRSARTKIELCNDIGKSTFPYGKTTGHTDIRDIRQLTGQLAPNSLDFNQVALSV